MLTLFGRWPGPIFLQDVAELLSLPSQKPIGILGLGVAYPDGIMSNADLEKLVDTTDEWILSRTGIRERRVLAPHERPSDFALLAAQRALADADIDKNTIDAVIYCSYTQEHIMPPASGLLHGMLDLPGRCMIFDLNAACTGFVTGLQTAYALIRSGLCKRILLFGVDCNSRMIDYTDRSTCILFGDGAGAVIVGEVPEGRGVLGNHAGADGHGSQLISACAGAGYYHPDVKVIDKADRFIKMNGREVYKFAVVKLVEAVEAALVDAGLQVADIDLLVPHQANQRIIDSALHRFGFSPEKAVQNMVNFGNTSAASVPLALNTAREDGRLKPGTTCALVAFGAGLTYAATIVKW